MTALVEVEKDHYGEDKLQKRCADGRPLHRILILFGYEEDQDHADDREECYPTQNTDAQEFHLYIYSFMKSRRRTPHQRLQAEDPRLPEPEKENHHAQDDEGQIRLHLSGLQGGESAIPWNPRDTP